MNILSPVENQDAGSAISRCSLLLQLSGEVIRLSGPALRFDVSWFIPEFTRHRRQLSEVLVLSLLLQILALIAPLFYQVVMDKVLVHNTLIEYW